MIPTSYSASAGYVDANASLWDAMAAAHGPVETAGAAYPAMSNGELVAIVNAWKRAAARSRTPTWGLAYDLLLSALGWSKPGDRFVMTRDHAKAPADDAAVILLWQSTADLAGQLDAADTVRKPLIVDWSYAGYEQAARDSWREMKARGIIPPLPDKPPPSPIAPVLPPTLPKPSRSSWLLVALLVAAWATTRRKRS